MDSSWAAIDIRGLIRCLCSSNSRGLALVTRASSNLPQNLNPEPRRIKSHVKLNLQFLKRVKELTEKRTGSRPSTSFRRKKVEKSLSSAVDEDTERTYLDDSDQYGEVASPVLLVDGYNMCGYWSKLKKHFRRGHLEHARQILLQELVGFGAVRGIKVVVVFDAVTSGLPDHKEMFQGIDVVYSSSRSADIWIETEVTLLKEDGCPRIWVATSDHTQQQCAYAAGAFVWSCRVLLAAIKDARKERNEVLMLLERTSYSTKGKLLEDNLDPEVCHTLKMLKKQLAQSEPS